MTMTMTMKRSALLVGLTAVALAASGCGGGGSSSPRASMPAPPTMPQPTPRPAPTSMCEVGGTVSAGNPCTYEAGGRTYTLRIDGTRVCLGTNICAGNLNISSANNNVETSGSGSSRRIVRLSPSTPAAMPAPAPTPTPAPQPMEPPVRTAAAMAAGNTPNSGSGSVTQSSIGAGGVTADSVSVEVVRNAGGTISWTVREAGGWSVDRASARVVAEPSGEGWGEGWTGIYFHQALGGGRGRGLVTGPGLLVEAFTDRYTDYLASGIWVRTNAAGLADQFGAFVDGADPFRHASLAGLTGTAMYRIAEGATMMHSIREGQRQTNRFVDADVTLTARFGDANSLGSIGGTVSNFTTRSGTAGAYGGVSISLETASIGSADSGFFTGATSSSGMDSAFTGKWGGKFYGNGAAGDRPRAVAGTFGAATADGGEAFIGTFRGYR